MPVITVRLVNTHQQPDPPDLAERLAGAIGEVLKSRPGRTWVQIHRIDESDYAENEAELDGVGPVFVSILQAERPIGSELQRQVDALTSAIASTLQRRRSDIHLLFEASGAGRVSFGGKLVE